MEIFKCDCPGESEPVLEILKFTQSAEVEMYNFNICVFIGLRNNLLSDTINTLVHTSVKSNNTIRIYMDLKKLNVAAFEDIV